MRHCSTVCQFAQDCSAKSIRTLKTQNVEDWKCEAVTPGTSSEVFSAFHSVQLQPI